MKSNVKWGAGIFFLITLMGALVFSAGGHTWGNEPAAVVVGVTLALALMIGGMVAIILSDPMQ